MGICWLGVNINIFSCCWFLRICCAHYKMECKYSLNRLIWRIMTPKLVLLLRVRVKLGVMSMKKYFPFPRSPEQRPPHEMQLSAIARASFFFFCFFLMGWVLPLCWKNSVFKAMHSAWREKVRNSLLRT